MKGCFNIQHNNRVIVDLLLCYEQCTTSIYTTLNDNLTLHGTLISKNRTV